MFGVLGINDYRNLVGSERTLVFKIVDEFGSGPALGRLEHDHRPAWPRCNRVFACLTLDILDILYRFFHGGGHEAMHGVWVISFDEHRCPAAAFKEALKLVMIDPGKNSWIADLVTIEMKDGQNSAIAGRVEELV